MRPDRLATARKLAQHGEVEVAVAGERQRPRDRRRRHVQGVRRALRARLGIQRGPLPDAEAVLLVDDGDRQTREPDGLLDQRVGADDQRQLSGRELREQVRPPARGRRTREQPNGHELPGQKRLNRREVLLGERLRRGHQRALEALLDRPQQRVQGHHGLARSDLSHQQPLHRALLREVVVDRLQRVLLVAGERKRQQLG